MNLLEKSVVYFDLDGTLADASHRLHHIKEKPKNWKAFFNGIIDDSIISPTYLVLTALARKFKIVFVTGRPESTREDTVRWLKDHKIFQDADYSGLYMRKTGDYRSDVIVKKELLDEVKSSYNVFCAFEDRPRVIEMLRNEGIFVFDVYQGSEEF